ncbi:MAG TPA: type VI secretion system tube protein Hcp [Verrucomicrobiae bacterium]
MKASAIRPVIKSALYILAAYFSFSGTIAAEVFIRFGPAREGLPGESKDEVFRGAEGWNQVASFQWAVTADTSWTKGGGASVGKPSPQSFEVTRKVDAASAGLLRAILTGTSFSTVEVVVRDHSRSGATDTAAVPLRYEFTGVFMTSIAPAGDSLSPVETVSFVFKTITMKYRPVLEDGQLGKEIVVSWDVPAGTVTGP